MSEQTSPDKTPEWQMRLLASYSRPVAITLIAMWEALEVAVMIVVLVTVAGIIIGFAGLAFAFVAFIVQEIPLIGVFLLALAGILCFSFLICLPLAYAAKNKELPAREKKED